MDVAGLGVGGHTTLAQIMRFSSNFLMVLCLCYLLAQC